MSTIDIAGGIALAVIAAMMLWRLRGPAATPEAQAIRAPVRMLAACQGLLGLSFLIPDVRVHATALLIVIVPAVIAIIRMWKAMQAPDTRR